MSAYGDITRTFTLAERLERIALAPDETSRLLEEGELAQALLDGTPSSKVPEGYAYYGVYPELYARAARRAGPKTRRRIVVGIRTIGTSLGAVVANAVGVDRFVTVRPAGDPFRRTLELDDALREILGDENAEYFIVDEGPGLSGSSFVAVADAIRSHHIYFLPSHDNGPGAQADEHIRSVWASAKTLYEPFVFDATMFEPLIGRVDRVVDLGAGAWRAHLGVDAPAWITHERRKYLLDAGDTRWLAKFAGLGAYGREKLDKAQRLAARGVIPRVAGLIDGFLVTEWRDGTHAIDRDSLLDALGRYLLAIADERAASWRSSADVGARFSTQLVDIDGRMHAWEWIATAGGDVIKCDALDHSSSHDGIGVQDLAWDFAGAAVEHSLSDDEVERLRSVVGAKRSWTDDQLEFFRDAYCRVQREIFLQAARESADDEAAKLIAHAERYK